MTLNTARVHQVAEILSTALEGSRSLARTLNDAIARAYAQTDPNLSAVGLEAKREETARALREAARVDLEALENRIRVAAADADAHGRELLAIPADDTAAWLRANVKWAQVERALDRNDNDFRNVIDSADVDTLKAITEYGPARARDVAIAAATRTGLEARLSLNPAAAGEKVRSQVLAGFARATTDPVQQMAARSAAAAAQKVAEAAPYLATTRRMVEGQPVSMMDTAISSHVASQTADNAQSAAAAA